MRKDLVSSAILLCIAGLYYLGTRDIPESTLEDAFGPRGFPAVLAALLAVVALGIGARALVRSPASGKADKEEEAPWPRALGMLALGALYIPMSMILGYALALLLLLIVVMLYEGMRPSWSMFAVAAGGAIFFWVLFEYVLGVRQPEGLLF